MIDKFLWHIAVLIYSVAFISCSESPTDIENQTTEWKTVFYDDFDRDNTVNGDLGNNWVVRGTTDASIMQIIENEVYAVRETPDLGAPETCPYAQYIAPYDHIVMRISIRARTDANPIYPIFMLFAGADSLLRNGYIVGYKHDAFHRYSPGGENITPYEVSANASYSIKITVKSKGYLWEVNDASSGELLVYGGTDDEVNLSGRIGFIAGAPSPGAVYIEDFRIEVPKYK